MILLIAFKFKEFFYILMERWDFLMQRLFDIESSKEFN